MSILSLSVEDMFATQQTRDINARYCPSPLHPAPISFGKYAVDEKGDQPTSNGQDSAHLRLHGCKPCENTSNMRRGRGSVYVSIGNCGGIKFTYSSGQHPRPIDNKLD